jgi:hypothetical protein
MARGTYMVAAAVTVVGLVAASCGSSPSSNNASSSPNTTAVSGTSPTNNTTASSAPSATSTPSATTTATGASADLPSLIPTPTNTQRTDGPDAIHDNGTHLHFLVNGTPSDAMAAYKTALEGKGWTVTVQNSGGNQGGGGATYTGTNGSAYGVFTGGGYGNNTDINACAWQSKPSDTNCGDRN